MQELVRGICRAVCEFIKLECVGRGGDYWCLALVLGPPIYIGRLVLVLLGIGMTIMCMCN